MRLRRLRALKPRLARSIGLLSRACQERSTVRQETPGALLHRLVDHVVLAQASQTLARLLLHPVVAAGLRAANAARAGDPETLGRRLFRLHLRHGAESAGEGRVR